MFYRLNPPPDELARSESEISSVRQMFKARKARIGKEKRKEIDSKIRRMIDDWEKNTSGLRSKLSQLNDFYEGQQESVDFPFGPETSSSIDVRLAAGYGRLLRAQFIRAVFSDPTRTYMMVDTPGMKREDLNKVEIAINWTSENENNLNDTLKDSWIPCYRDGTSLLHGRWERKIEAGCDYKHYKSAEEFQSDYQTADDAGVSEEEYQEIVDNLREPDASCRVEYEMHFVSQNGPVFSLCPFAKFIRHPLQQQDMSKLTLYGFMYNEGKNDFEQKASAGYYDSEAANVSRRNSPGNYSSDSLNSWDDRRQALEGVGNMDTEAVSYRLAHLVFTDDIDNDGVDQKFLVIYDLDKHISLRIEPYGIRRNILSMIPLRLVRREGRLPGASLLGDSEALFREINALHRHRSNQRRITDSVTMLLPEGCKDHIDLGAEYDSFRPGTPFWVPDQYMNPNLSPRQLTITSTSRTNESVDEESFIQKYLDLLTGASQGQSGRESSIDPNAPASKTAMLLSRADLRVEDLIDEWRRTVPDILDLARALYYQNAGSDINVMTKKGDGAVEQTIPLELLGDPRIKGVLKPIKPSISPEIEMQKYAALGMAAQQFIFPVKMKPDILIHLWNDYVAASRIERPERFQIEQGPGGQMSMGGQPVDPNQFAQGAAALQTDTAAVRDKRNLRRQGKPGEAKPGYPAEAGKEAPVDFGNILNSMRGGG